MIRQPVPSPCVGHCVLDDAGPGATGWCWGCGRTITEIIAWPTATDTDKRAVLDMLSPRMDLLGQG